MVHWLVRLRYWLLGDRRRRRALERLPLGGPIAERHRRALFDDMAGAVRSQALLACHEAGLFDALADRARERATLERRIDLPGDALDRLLALAQACGLVERASDAYALTVRGLVAAREPAVRAMIGHGALLHRDLADWRRLLSGEGAGALGAFWPYRGGTGDAEGYSRLMRESLPLVSEPLLEAVNFDRFERVLEIGGGDGSLALALAGRYAQPAITLVDLPAVAPLAQVRIAEAGLADRIAVAPRKPAEPLPAGHDCILLVRLLHDLGTERATALLQRAAQALPPNGTLIVAEPTARRGRDAQTAYFTAYFAAMGSGRLRTRAELIALARDAGLGNEKPVRTGTSLLSVLKFGHSTLS